MMITKANIEKGENTGLIQPRINPLDFVSGGETGLTYQVRLLSFDWEAFKPSNERQYRLISSVTKYDTMSCVTFSGLNSIESQIIWMMKNNLIPADKLQLMKDLGYFDENGLPNFSDWFSAIMNGTTPQGNNLQAFWQSAKDHGLLPQRDGYSVNDFETTEDWLNPARITQAMKDKALRFKEIFDVAYEWAIIAEGGNAQGQFEYHLKQAPLHIATPTCGSWNNAGIVTNCGDYKRLNHATLNIGIVKPSYYKDLDHYNPFVKKLAWDYYIPFALKGVVMLKTAKPSTPSAPAYNWTRSLSKGMTGKDVELLQSVLLIEVPADFKATATGFFGDWTMRGVIALQNKYASEILTPVGLTKGTGFVGTSTIKWLNKKYHA